MRHTAQFPQLANALAKIATGHEPSDSESLAAMVEAFEAIGDVVVALQVLAKAATEISQHIQAHR